MYSLVSSKARRTVASFCSIAVLAIVVWQPQAVASPDEPQPLTDLLGNPIIDGSGTGFYASDGGSAGIAVDVLIDFDDLNGCKDSVLCGDIITNQYAGDGAIFVNPDFDTRANEFLGTLGIFVGFSRPNLAFVAQGGGSSVVPPQEIRFSVPVRRVSLFYGHSSGGAITLELFGANGLLASKTEVGVDQAGQGFGEGVIELEASENVVRAEVHSPRSGLSLNFSMDDVRFSGPDEGCGDKAKLAAKCKKGGTKVIGKLKKATPATNVTFQLDGGQDINKTTNAKGKAKAKWSNQASGGHRVTVCDLSDSC